MFKLVFVLTTILSLVASKKYTIELKPFTAIKTCVPYTVQIKASDNKDLYSVDLDVDEDVYKAFNADVKDGDLVLSSSGKFETDNAIKVTVNMPSAGLTSVVASGVGDILMSGQIVTDELDIVSGGTKTIFAPDIEIKKQLTIDNNGIGDISLIGSISGKVDVSLSGIANVYLKGVSGQVNLDGSGISTLGVESPEGDAVIRGSASGLGKVQYTAGQCLIGGSFFFLSPCEKVASIDIPEISTPLSWTCGIKVEGNTTCGVSGASTHTFVSDGGASSMATASSSGGNVISSRSLIGLDGMTTASVSGQGASASAVTSSKCNVPSEELVIVDQSVN